MCSLSRMLKKSASGVLASLRDSRYRSVRLASLLAAALLDGLFEHPEAILTPASHERFHPCFCINRVFPQPAGASPIRRSAPPPSVHRSRPRCERVQPLRAHFSIAFLIAGSFWAITFWAARTTRSRSQVDFKKSRVTTPARCSETSRGDFQFTPSFLQDSGRSLRSSFHWASGVLEADQRRTSASSGSSSCCWATRKKRAR